MSPALSWSRLSLLPLLALLGACASSPSAASADNGATFIVVRHAEKAGDDPRDPHLSAAGQARAQALAQRLRDTPVTAAYATEFRRTRETASPTAQTHGIPVVAYDARSAASATAAHWKTQHPRGTVLVVGHSNTVPDLVAALCQCSVQAMDDSEYDRLSIVRIDAAGAATLDVQRYGAPSP